MGELAGGGSVAVAVAVRVSDGGQVIGDTRHATGDTQHGTHKM